MYKSISTSFRQFSTHAKKYTELSEVPIIDMEPFIKGNQSNKIKVADKIDYACSNSGFFMVRNHGIEDTVINEAFDVSQRFYDMSVEEKEEVRVTPSYAYGYQAIENLSLSKSNEDITQNESEREKFVNSMADLKECWAVCLGSKELESAGYKGVDLKGFQGPMWHSNPKDLVPKITNYYRSVEQLSNHILEAFTLCLDLEKDFFTKKNTNHLSALRTLNYPKLEDLNSIKPGQLRCSAHSDYGTLTILKERLLTDQYVGYTGLQLEGKDKWYDVRVPEDCYTINLGDLMAFWTNQRWRSTNHRVNVPNLENNYRRLSIAYFQNLNNDVLIESLDGDNSKNELFGKITAGKYLMDKFYKTQSN